MDVGFVILSHNDPPALRRLAGRLNQSYDSPPIVCHHDFHRLRLDTSDFSDNIRFVEEPVQTAWGDISLVQAFRLALRQLYAWKPVDWFVLLSATDYPIKRAASVLAELCNSPYDAYLDHRAIPAYTELPGAQDGDLELGTKRPYWVRIAYHRYIARSFSYPIINRRGQLCKRWFRLAHPRWVGANPFNHAFKCYAGDAWITARGRCAELLMSDADPWPQLLRYYRKRQIPDESLIHTVLCNAPGLRICRDNKRYADWRDGRPSPKWLGLEDLPRLLNSSSHFARKFSERRDSRVLDELDRLN